VGELTGPEAPRVGELTGPEAPTRGELTGPEAPTRGELTGFRGRPRGASLRGFGGAHAGCRRGEASNGAEDLVELGLHIVEAQLDVRHA